MKNGLKIYACSGLCNSIGTAPEDFTYWRDDTITIRNTRAVNALLADINLLEAQLQYDNALTDQEVISALCQIDLYVTCLMFAQQLSQDELSRAGRVIGEMINEGKYQYASLDDGERDEHLVQVCHEAQARFTAGDDPQISTNFTIWFEDHVTMQSYCGLNADQQLAAEQWAAEQKEKVGATDNTDAADLLFDCGEYYLYLYMTRSQAYAQSKAIGRKWDKQKQVYEFIHSCYDPIYGSKEAVDKIIYTGICRQLKTTPTQAIKDLTGYTTKGIGEGVAAIISAIVALLSFIITAIGTIISFVVSVDKAKYQTPSDAESATPEGEDWEDPIAGKKLSTRASIGIVAIGAAVLAAIYSMWKH